MVQTRKFSQFEGPAPIQAGDIVVGLRNGMNWQFTGVGSGGGGGTGVTIIIDQPGHGLNPGDWVRINSLGLFVKALADTPENAEIAGCVVLDPTFNANQFTLQVVGYVGPGVFSGLIPGRVYFLSDTSLGTMVLAEPSDVDDISLPLFIAYTATSGFIRQSRGVVINGIGAFPPSGGGGDDPSIITVTQPGHNLNLGDVVRLAGSVTYVRALSDTLANAQAVGVVIEVIDINTFRLQSEGYCIDAILTNSTGGDMVAAGVYYLSETVPGRVTLVAPTAVGEATKPIFICEQGAIGTSAGWIVPQRPLEITAATTNNQIVNVTQAGHTFVVGDWLYVAGDTLANRVYAKGQSNVLGTSNVAGVVISIVAGVSFVLQTGGYNTGAVTLDAAGMPVVPGTVYYLSPTVAGKITSTAPTTIGQYVVRCFECERNVAISGVYAGYIQDMRPIAVPSAPSGASAWQLITMVNLTNVSTIDLSNIPGIGLYKNLKFSGRGLVVERLTPSSSFICYDFWFRVAMAGVIKADFNYIPSAYQPIVNGSGSALPVLSGAAPPNAFGYCSADGKQSVNFDILIPNANSTTTFKMIHPEADLILDSGGTNPNLSARRAYHTDGYGSAPDESDGIYVGDIQALSGLYFFFAPQLTPGSTFIIRSGTLSVYGEIA